ncbi:hypothetical protein ACFRLW_33085 [Streptomyces sp. NPDC056728]
MVDVHSASNELRLRARGGESPESLSHPALDLARRAGAGARGVAFDEDVRRMAVRVAGGTTIHGGRAAGPERMRGARVLAAYLHALADGGVHLITPDEGQAEEEGAHAEAVCRSLGVSVGVLRTDLGRAERKAAYDADVTVGAYRRFGLDLLHDRQAPSSADLVRRDAPAAVVNDPGHVLIAPVVEPLTLTEHDGSPAMELRNVAWCATTLRAGTDYVVDAERNVARLTPVGRSRMHDAYGVVDRAGMETLLLEKRIGEALLAAGRFVRGQDYDVVNGAVVRIPSGALPGGFRYDAGLRQAIEVMEGVAVSDAEWITATVSVFEYFRRYSTVGGTSLAEIMFTDQLQELFGLEVWDRRTGDELSTQRQYEQEIIRYGELNRRIARWDRLGARQRAELYALRERTLTPHGLDTLVHRMINDAIRGEVRRSAGDPERLRRSLAQLVPGLPATRLVGVRELRRIADIAAESAQVLCAGNLSRNRERESQAVQHAINQAATYLAQAEMYYRDLAWPDDLTDFEKALTAIYERLCEELGTAVARHVLQRG